MNDELKSVEIIWEISNKHRDIYSDKLADLHKVIISVSGVLLSILGITDIAHNSQPSSEPYLILTSIVLFLFSVLFGMLALHGHAEIHQKIIFEINELVQKKSPKEVINQMRFSSVELGGLYKYSHNLTMICFFLAVLFLSFNSFLNV